MRTCGLCGVEMISADKWRCSGDPEHRRISYHKKCIDSNLARVPPKCSICQPFSGRSSIPVVDVLNKPRDPAMEYLYPWLAEKAKSVCRIDSLGNGVHTGTGFVFQSPGNPKVIITNSHVLPKHNVRHATFFFQQLNITVKQGVLHALSTPDIASENSVNLKIPDVIMVFMTEESLADIPAITPPSADELLLRDDPKGSVPLRKVTEMGCSPWLARAILLHHAGGHKLQVLCKRNRTFSMDCENFPIIAYGGCYDTGGASGAPLFNYAGAITGIHVAGNEEGTGLAIHFSVMNTFLQSAALHALDYFAHRVAKKQEHKRLAEDLRLQLGETVLLGASLGIVSPALPIDINHWSTTQGRLSIMDKMRQVVLNLQISK